MRQENRIGKAFDCVRASEELKASTKEFLRDARQLEQGRSKNRGLSRPAFRLALSAAGAMLTVFLCIGAYAMLWMPVAYVSIDLNPSLELTLNRLDRVIGVEAYNEDGQGILEGVSVKGMRYGDAIESIVGSEGMQPYLTWDAALTFTVATDSAPREEQMLEETDERNRYLHDKSGGLVLDILLACLLFITLTASLFDMTAFYVSFAILAVALILKAGAYLCYSRF